MAPRRPAPGATALALLTIAALTGCGSSSDSTGNASTTPTTTSEATVDVALASPGTDLTTVPSDEPLLEDTAAPQTSSPVESIAPEDEPSIANTTWDGTVDFGSGSSPVRVGFDGNGDVTLIEGESSVPDVTWTRTGNSVAVTTAGGFATLDGTIDGDSMALTGSNNRGQILTLTLTKQ